MSLSTLKLCIRWRGKTKTFHISRCLNMFEKKKKQPLIYSLKDFAFDYGPVPNGTLGPCGPPQRPYFHEVKPLWLLGRSLLWSSLQCHYRLQRGYSQAPFWNLKWQTGHPTACGLTMATACLLSPQERIEVCHLGHWRSMMLHVWFSYLEYFPPMISIMRNSCKWITRTVASSEDVMRVSLSSVNWQWWTVLVWPESFTVFPDGISNTFRECKTN